MKELEIYPSFDRIERQTYVADDPIDFASWLELAHTIDSELVRGVIINKMAAQYPHEWLFMWLAKTLGNFVDVRGLGKILGSRTAVKISEIDGRLPDIVFVRADNNTIIHDDAIYGVPDLVIEIVSKNDRPSDLVPLEADYRMIGVPEIIFIDPRKKRVRYLRKNDIDYDSVFLTAGRLTFAEIPGFHIEVEWLFTDDRPNGFDLVKQLLENSVAA